MELPKSRPAVELTVAFIKKGVETGRWQESGSLPSIRKLAVQLRVSPTTVLSAISDLKAQGVLESIGKSRPRIAGRVAGIPESPASGWRMKRGIVMRDILQGLYADAARLPSFKELQVRYGCCYATMQKVLRSLIDDGIVRMQERRAVLCNASGEHSDSRVVLINHSAGMLYSAFNQEPQTIAQTVERTCLQYRYRLETHKIDFYNPAEVRRFCMGIKKKTLVVGYIVELWWFESEDLRRAYLDLLERLAAHETPTAIVDELGTLELPFALGANPHLQVFRPEARRAGERVGRVLLEMGHRSVVYLSASHKFLWSLQRLQGVREQFFRAGFQGAVHSVVTDTMDVSLLHVLAVADFPEEMERRMLGVHLTEKQSSDQYRSLQEFKRTWQRNQFDLASIEELRSNLAHLATLTRHDPAPDFYDEIYEAFLRFAGPRLLAMHLVPLFKKALQVSGATAWICATDSFALAALRYLREKGVKIPREISVIGFDNVPGAALDNQLTTFDFNAGAAVHNVLNFIARPSRPRGPYRHVPIEVEGMVIERGSTGKTEK